jgi:hypothetical protein
MADVTGRIGDQDVALDNAATEATLKAILAAMQGQTAATSALSKKLTSTAKQAGVNPTVIASANKGIQEMGLASKAGSLAGKGLGVVFGGLSKGAMLLGGVLGDIVAGGIATGKNLMDLAGKMLDGGGQISDVFAAFKDLPFGIGQVAGLFEKLMLLQQAELETYRQLTKSGVNFAGDLSTIRLTALEMGTSLEGFGKLMSENSGLFSQLGGSVNDGAKNFVNLSKSIRNSDIGKTLQGLGYSIDDINSSTANYLKITGGRTSDEMKNTKALTESAGAYMTQLDMLASITGQSREQQEKALQEATANAAYEAYLQTLDEEGRKKATAAMQNALAVGGKGAADALKSQLMGLPPMTDAAKNFTALLPNAAAGVSKMGNAVNDTSKGLKDVNRAYSEAVVGSAKDAKNLGKEQMAAMSMTGGAMAETALQAQKNANMLNAKGIKTADEFDDHQKKIAAEQAIRAKSTAAAAAEAEDSFKKLSAELMAALLPVFKILTPIVTDLATKMTKFATENMPEIGKKLEKFVKFIIDDVIPPVMKFIQDLFSPEGRERISKMLGEALSSLVQKAWDSFKIFGNDSERPRGETNAGDIAEDPSYGGQAGSIPGAADGGIVKARPGGQLIKAAEVGMNEAFVPLPDGNKIPVDFDFKKLPPIPKEVLAEFKTIGSSMTDMMQSLLSKQESLNLNKENPFNLDMKMPSMTDLAKEFTSAKTSFTEKFKQDPESSGATVRDLVSNLKETVFGKPQEIPKGNTDMSSKDLLVELQTLNKQTAQMISFMRETTDFSRRNLDAIRGLNGNLLI